MNQPIFVTHDGHEMTIAFTNESPVSLKLALATFVPELWAAIWSRV